MNLERIVSSPIGKKRKIAEKWNLDPFLRKWVNKWYIKINRIDGVIKYTDLKKSNPIRRINLDNWVLKKCHWIFFPWKDKSGLLKMDLEKEFPKVCS